jgi:pimeloyl-ACP methyl ester carboxylesterase
VKPETKYARNGDVNIAYQVVGDGPRDLILVPGWVSNLDLFWEDPSAARFFERMASFGRLILFDKRGTGLSDRAEIGTLEVRMDDVRAVMDAARSSRATLLGYSEGGPMCMLFAATHPDRTAGLITIGSFPRRIWAPDYPFGMALQDYQGFVDSAIQEWGGPVGIDVRAPSVATDPRFRDWWARFLRSGISPGGYRRMMQMNCEIDVRNILPTIRVPTLIIHNTREKTVPVEAARYLAERIPGAKMVELPGIDHLPFVGNGEEILDEIEEFVTGTRRGVEPDRVLATVMFTDIVDSTRRAAELGDRRWREMLINHHAVVREQLTRFRGREIDTAGDGFLAAFDGPARAVRAACAVSTGVEPLGLTIRAGVHTGECEVMGAKLSGVAVHIGARVASLAQAGEVLVSQTVKDLVSGSGLRFDDRGVHALKGVPDQWHLYAADRSA